MEQLTRLNTGDLMVLGALVAAFVYVVTRRNVPMRDRVGCSVAVVLAGLLYLLIVLAVMDSLST